MIGVCSLQMLQRHRSEHICRGGGGGPRSGEGGREVGGMLKLRGRRARRKSREPVLENIKIKLFVCLDQNIDNFNQHQQPPEECWPRR